jgi:hypothetical protein
VQTLGGKARHVVEEIRKWRSPQSRNAELR